MIDNKLSGTIISAAMKVHTVLGPGLLERTYQACLEHELISRNIQVCSEYGMPVLFEGGEIDIGYRVDMLVENEIILELKATQTLLPIHRTQLFTYLRLSKKPLGLLLNFGEQYLKNGIIRIAN